MNGYSNPSLKWLVPLVVVVVALGVLAVLMLWAKQPDAGLRAASFTT